MFYYLLASAKNENFVIYRMLKVNGTRQGCNYWKSLTKQELHLQPVCLALVSVMNSAIFQGLYIYDGGRKSWDTDAIGY